MSSPFPGSTLVRLIALHMLGRLFMIAWAASNPVPVSLLLVAVFLDITLGVYLIVRLRDAERWTPEKTRAFLEWHGERFFASFGAARSRSH